MAGIADEMLSRQGTLQLTLPKSVAVVGCGGAGSWVALVLALAGVQELWLFDHDVVERHNLNRLPVSEDYIGKLKSEAVGAEIKRLRPDCRVLCMRGFGAELADQINLASHVEWVVVTTDTLASRRMIHAWALSHPGISYAEAAAEGEYGSCAPSPAEWATEAETQPGYASVPVWVGPCLAAAYLAVAHIVHTCHLDICRLGWHENTVAYNMHAEENEATEGEGNGTDN